jgi:hypothetical protein
MIMRYASLRLKQLMQDFSKNLTKSENKEEGTYYKLFLSTAQNHE